MKRRSTRRNMITRIMSIFLISAVAVVVASHPWFLSPVTGSESQAKLKDLDRNEQAAPVTILAPAVDPETEQLLQALRDAKSVGDEETARKLEAALGWATATEVNQPPRIVPSYVVVRKEKLTEGEKFQDDILVNNPAWSSGKPDMASRSNGTLYIVVEDLNGNYADVYMSTNSGSTWAYQFSIAPPAEDPINPSIAIGEGNYNRLLIAYEYGSNTMYSAIRVYWRDLDDIVPPYTEATVEVETNPYFALKHPRICVDSPEYPYWYAYLAYSKGILGKRNDSYDLRFSRTVSYGVIWDAPTNLATGVTPEDKPDIDFGENRLYLVYTYDNSPSYNEDIYLRRSANFGLTWDTEVGLATSSFVETNPRVAATNGGGAVVVAFTKEYTSDWDIESYYSLNSGNSWALAYLPYTTDYEQTVDLSVSYSHGKIHAAFWRSHDIVYTWADHTQPWNWSNTVVVNELNAALSSIPPAVAVDPTRPTEQCVTWMDNRNDNPNAYRVYFDTAAWDTAIIDPGGGGDYPNIQSAITDADDGAVIILTNGTFSGPGNVDLDFLGKSIELRSQSGNPNLTVIDCQGSAGNPHRGIWFHSGEGPGAVVSGISIINGYVVSSKRLPDPGNGGGILIATGTSPVLENLIIQGNAASEGGGGLHCEPYSAPTIIHCVIVENASQEGGGGLHCGIASEPTVENCTIAGNDGPVAGGIYIETGAYVILINSIIAFNGTGMAVYCQGSPTVILTCCDVYGNDGGDWVNCIATQLGIEGNFSLDPLFCLDVTGEYTLQLESPCIPSNNTCGVLIGALGYGCVIDAVAEQTPPSQYGLDQNYPNPFNPVTWIRFALPRQQQINLSIYSLAGRLVATLVDGEMPAGNHSISWNGYDDRGRALSSGSYIYRLSAGEFSETRRMMLLK